MRFQTARLVGAVVAARMVTLVRLGSLGSLVGRQVGLFVRYQAATVVGFVVAALMVTLERLGSLGSLFGR